MRGTWLFFFLCNITKKYYGNLRKRILNNTAIYGTVNAWIGNVTDNDTGKLSGNKCIEGCHDGYNSKVTGVYVGSVFSTTKVI